jgi:cysteinyl-tRNA synthetase
MAIRHQLLTAHYRHQLDFTLDGLDESKQAISRLWNFIDRLNNSAADGEHNEEIDEAVKKAYEDFEARMDDDLNVPGATGAVFTLMNTVNKFLVDGDLDGQNVEAVNEFMDDADSVLGYIAHERGALDEEIEALIQEREQAREDGDYDRADEIRDELKEMGIVLEDTPEGTHWRRAE